MPETSIWNDIFNEIFGYFKEVFGLENSLDESTMNVFEMLWDTLRQLISDIIAADI